MNATAPTLAPSNITAAREFTRHLAELLRKERDAMVNFLLALAECDGRRLWADLGYASLFDYLHRELGMSKAAAFYRKTAAGLVHRYPAIVEALGDGRLCITSLAEVAKVITPENAAEILPRFFHRSSREAKEIAVAIAPMTAPPRREVLSVVQPKRLGQPPAPTASTRTVQALEPERALSRGSREQGGTEPSAALRRSGGATMQPLNAELRRLHVTVSKRWVEKLDAARAALSHSVPSGSAEEVLEAALDALLEREAKRKGLRVRTPRTPPVTTVPSPESCARKGIPAHVRREVLVRDRGQCQARLHDGTVCGSTTRAQLDHVIPVALGGPSTVENVRVLCERHNQLAARAVFGDAAVELFARRRK